jgi:hypothetical protein
MARDAAAIPGGYVKAASREAAETEAARLFSLTEFQRRALLLQERV